MNAPHVSPPPKVGSFAHVVSLLIPTCKAFWLNKWALTALLLVYAAIYMAWDFSSSVLAPDYSPQEWLRDMGIEPPSADEREWGDEAQIADAWEEPSEEQENAAGLLEPFAEEMRAGTPPVYAVFIGVGGFVLSILLFIAGFYLGVESVRGHPVSLSAVVNALKEVSWRAYGALMLKWVALVLALLVPMAAIGLVVVALTDATERLFWLIFAGGFIILFIWWIRLVMKWLFVELEVLYHGKTLREAIAISNTLMRRKLGGVFWGQFLLTCVYSCAMMLLSMLWFVGLVAYYMLAEEASVALQSAIMIPYLTLAIALNSSITPFFCYLTAALWESLRAHQSAV